MQPCWGWLRSRLRSSDALVTAHCFLYGTPEDPWAARRKRCCCKMQQAAGSAMVASVLPRPRCTNALITASRPIPAHRHRPWQHPRS
jgi:hypothetical protein